MIDGNYLKMVLQLLYLYVLNYCFINCEVLCQVRGYLYRSILNLQRRGPRDFFQKSVLQCSIYSSHVPARPSPECARDSGMFLLLYIYAIGTWLSTIFSTHIHQDPAPTSLPFLIPLEKIAFPLFSSWSFGCLAFSLMLILFWFILWALFCLFSYALNWKLLKGRNTSNFTKDFVHRNCVEYIEWSAWRQAKRHFLGWG